MDLCSVTVSCFRRFRERSSLQTHGKLVALLGPNEAGKSSLLRAISMLDNDLAPPTSDFTRGADKSTFSIEGRFFLSPEDLADAGLDGPHWLHVKKAGSGSRSLTIEPQPAKRDLSLRRKVLGLCETAMSHPRFGQSIEDDDDDIYHEWSVCEGILASDVENLSENQQGELVNFAASITSHVHEKLPAALRSLPGLFDQLLEHEAKPSPGDQAIARLRDRLPAIIAFDEDARDLAPEYAISDLENGAPAALNNLCDLAGLRLTALVDAYKAGDTAAISTIEHKANRVLEDRFRTDWKQSGVHVSIRLQGDSLAIQVVNERAEFTSLAERSDGLRQFVALLAFAAGRWRPGSILLIDEVEQRLHYDAQADLVQMLARQQITSKVIYTTHSAGCLPEDLGNGVRFARPRLDDETHSEIRNNFWAESDPGFTPLLFGMGASTLAFFPTRNAVMVEGPSDMLLLPTLIRAAMATQVIGYQFVPGLSYSDGLLHASAIGKAVGVLYLVDGDAGGAKIRKALADRGVPDANIFSLGVSDGAANDVEDFVHAELLLEAINSLLGKYHAKVAPFTKADLPSKRRMDAAEKMYKSLTKEKLPKVALAYEILRLVSESPTRQILDAKRSGSFKAVASKVEDRFRALSDRR